MKTRTLAGVYVALVVAGVAAIRAMPAQFPGLPGAGQAAPPTGTGMIVGRVIDAVTGRGVAGAQVAISAAPAGLGAIQAGDTIPMDQLMSLDLGSVLSGIRQVLTDAQGRFAFT